MDHIRHRQRAPSPHMFRSRSTTTSPTTRTSMILEPKPSHQNPQLIRRSKSQRSSLHHSSVSSTASSGSKSAWALSPGRSFAPSPPPPDHSKIKNTTVHETMKSNKTVRGGVSSVLKYFKSKKTSPKEQDEFHQFKLLHNRLLQWRFTNAKSESAMASLKVHAENKLFSVSLQILKLRNTVMEKRRLLQMHQHMIKSLHIINPQIDLLEEEWTRLENRNFEALNRMTRKLCAISVQLPLISGAQGHVDTVYDSISIAMDSLEYVEETIPKLLHQVEMIYGLVEELIATAERQRECVEEFSGLISNVSLMEVVERSSQICLIQSIEETMSFKDLG